MLVAIRSLVVGAIGFLGLVSAGAEQKPPAPLWSEIKSLDGSRHTLCMINFNEQVTMRDLKAKPPKDTLRSIQYKYIESMTEFKQTVAILESETVEKSFYIWYGPGVLKHDQYIKVQSVKAAPTIVYAQENDGASSYSGDSLAAVLLEAFTFENCGRAD